MAASSNPSELVLLYDGVCGLCNRLTRFILPRDPGGIFRYASLQSDYAGNVLERHHRRTDDLDTVYLLIRDGDSERLLSRSDAALFVLGKLTWPWKAAAILSLLPRFIRNAVYDLIARHRYRVFGKHETCPIPEPKWQERFIDI